MRDIQLGNLKHGGDRSKYAPVDTLRDWETYVDDCFSGPDVSGESNHASKNTDSSYHDRKLYTSGNNVMSSFSPRHSTDVLSRISTERRQHKLKWWKFGLSGWRFGVASGSLLATIVLVINTILTILATSISLNEAGIVTLINGSCSKTKQWGAGLHLLINVLSTALLAASNYTIQCLGAPTRHDVDLAHAKGAWLDIGVPSIRNLRWISWRKLFLMVLLALGSVPLHLLYNSAVFETIATNDYEVLVVSESFLSGAPWEVDADQVDNAGDITNQQIQFYQDNAKQWQRLNNTDCINAYSNDITTSSGSVLAVTTYQNRSTSLINILGQSLVPGVSTTNEWICTEGADVYDALCDVNTVLPHAATWTVSGYPIEYCLSQVVPERCKLQFSITMMIVVIIFNALKVACMFYGFWGHKEKPLVTIGDAIDSFLEDPDPVTQGLCLMTKHDAIKGTWISPDRAPKPWQPATQYWHSAVGRWRWFSCLVLCTLTVTGAIVLLIIGIHSIAEENQSSDLTSLWSMGFGAVNANSLLRIGQTASDEPGGGPNSTLDYVLLANTPQILFSFLYLMYNGIFTSMLNADEWSRFGTLRKSLRVTMPRGHQRSTYWLQLPYTYAIPLMIASSLMHWLVSQSIFLAKIDRYDIYGKENTSGSITTAGYSCISIIFAVIVGSLMLLTLMGISLRKFNRVTLLVGSCSVAISAACHRVSDDVDAAFLPLMWGAVSEGEHGVPGHCTFSSEEVAAPIKGTLYAGVS
ncbi:MAG: hypothetical protein M1827_003735 [Pycnora praestabilis]|nr:MAG: hypothetical protein M1827_003735 [Pycnora praestabilis]